MTEWVGQDFSVNMTLSVRRIDVRLTPKARMLYTYIILVTRCYVTKRDPRESVTLGI